MAVRSNGFRMRERLLGDGASGVSARWLLLVHRRDAVVLLTACGVVGFGIAVLARVLGSPMETSALIGISAIGGIFIVLMSIHTLLVRYLLGPHRAVGKIPGMSRLPDLVGACVVVWVSMSGSPIALTTAVWLVTGACVFGIHALASGLGLCWELDRRRIDQEQSAALRQIVDRRHAGYS